jgi:hypothetical protein
MNSIYFCRLIITLGSLGLTSPLIAQTGPGSGGQPGSIDRIPAAISGGSSSQGNQGSSAANPNRYGSDSSATSSKISGERPSRGAGNRAERAFNVDPRTLPKSATDMKFQGSLFDLGVKSIAEVKSLPDKANASTVANDKGDPDKKHTTVPEAKPAAVPNPGASASPVAKSAGNR